MTMLLFLSLSTIVIGLGVVSLVMGLAIRHQIRSVVALTLGGAVILAGLTLFYESMTHRKIAGRSDAFIVNAGAYFKYRNTHLKPYTGTARKPVSGKSDAGHQPAGMK